MLINWSVTRTQHIVIDSGTSVSSFLFHPLRNEILTRLTEYNLYKDKMSEKLKHREHSNRIFFEGLVKIYWGLKKHITVAPRNSYGGRKSALRDSRLNYVSIDDESFGGLLENAGKSELTSEELKKFWELSQASMGVDEQLTQSLNETALARG